LDPSQNLGVYSILGQEFAALEAFLESREMHPQSCCCQDQDSNIVQLMIDGGIFPSNSFPLRLRYSKLLSFENVEGMVP
jgi:hypothetical protein